MVPGSIADYLQAADLAGLMFGLAVALWASMKKEAGRTRVRTRSGRPVTKWSADRDRVRLVKSRSPQRSAAARVRPRVAGLG